MITRGKRFTKTRPTQSEIGDIYLIVDINPEQDIVDILVTRIINGEYWQTTRFYPLSILVEDFKKGIYIYD